MGCTLSWTRRRAQHTLPAVTLLLPRQRQITREGRPWTEKRPPPPLTLVETSGMVENSGSTNLTQASQRLRRAGRWEEG